MQAAENYRDYELIAELSKGLGAPMRGIDIATLPPEARMQDRSM